LLPAIPAESAGEIYVVICERWRNKKPP